MAPKSKKTSYVLSSDAFNLKFWSEAVRLNESPLLTYRLQDHLLEGAKMGLVSFSNFTHFQVFLRWKPNTFWGVGTCLGWIFLVEKYLKMPKNHLLSMFVHTGFKSAYAACAYACATRLHVYMGLFMRMHIFIEFIHMQFPTCVRMLRSCLHEHGPTCADR